MSQPQPLKLNAFSLISQTLRLPIPIPSVPIKLSEMLLSYWLPSTPDFIINSSATFPVIPCQQQTEPAGPTGKLVPNRRELYEKAYTEYQNENRLLKEKVAILKRRLSRFENYGFDSGLGITSSDMQLFDKHKDNSTHKDVIINNNCSSERIYLQDYLTLHINNGSSFFMPKSYSPFSNETLFSFMPEYEEPSNQKNRSRSSTHLPEITHRGVILRFGLN
ncbi:hypothetical protein C2G38_2212074 [Gigaspora rosea]|uniref:Uncharacterized protein n=1 Tax=Gigaspora rosea TaxID=44941 RepID=A0A397UHK4_9GLOM|nr:hypothetical protein C2G38_2212074 [Gigaspora rosea]